METETKSSRTVSLLILYDMQTKFFLSALEGISDTDAHKRLNTKANHIAWLTGSLVQQRYELAGIFRKAQHPAGSELQQKAHDLFKDGQGIRDGITYPSLQDFKHDWQIISPDLKNALTLATDPQLESPFEMPGHSMSVYDLLTFIIYREANCIGQIALWRRLLGYEAMKYY